MREAMKHKSCIKSIYYWELANIIICLLSGIAGLLFFIIFASELANIKYYGVFVLFVSVIGFSLLIFWSIKDIIPMLKDYNNLKEGRYVIVRGEVIGFKSNRDPEFGMQINSKPIVATENDEVVVLKVNLKLEKGATYCFKYLKNSHIATAKVVKENNY